MLKHGSEGVCFERRMLQHSMKTVDFANLRIGSGELTETAKDHQFTMFLDLRLFVCFTGISSLPRVSTQASALSNDARSSMGDAAAAAAALD